MDVFDRMSFLHSCKLKRLNTLVSVDCGKFLRNHTGPNDGSVMWTLAFLLHSKEFVGLFVCSLHLFTASVLVFWHNFELLQG